MSFWIGRAALGVAGYLRGERLDFATTVRDDAAEKYRSRFRRAR